MLAIAQGRPATIGYTFESDGVDTDPAPDSATVSVYSPAGELVVEDAQADDVGDGAFINNLTAADVPALGVYRAVWTATFDGVELTFTDYIEVVGGFYFSIGEFKARYVNDEQVQNLSAEQIAEARATAEEIIEGLDAEDGTHQAFVPRAETFELHGSCIEIPRYRVRTIESLSIDGDAVDVDDLLLDGRKIVGIRWNGPVSVTVTHGWDAPPRRIKDAAILLAYHRAVKGPIDDRATGRLVPDGSVITLATPGMRGAVTGIPEVDAAISQYSKRRIKPTSVHIGEGPVDSFGSGWREGVWP